MTGKSLNFHLQDDENVTIALSNSARISLTDITAATIGNLSEDSQWADNSATDTGISVLRPWEDNSNPDVIKSDAIPQNVVYESKQPPTYKEHLKRHLENDDNADAHDVTKRIKLQPTDQVKDYPSFSNYSIVPIQDSAGYTFNNMSHVTNIPVSAYNTSMAVTSTGGVQNYQPIYATQNSQLDVNSQRHVHGTSLYSSLIDISTNNYKANSSNENSMPNTSTQNSNQHLSTQNSVQCLPIPNSMQNLSKQSVLPSLTKHHLVQSSSQQNLLPSLSTRNLMQILPNLTPISSLSSQNSNQSSLTQDSYVNSSTDSQHLISDAKNSQQSVTNQNLILNYQTINSAEFPSTTEQLPFSGRSSNINYLPWKNTLPSRERKNFENVKADDKLWEQTALESGNLIIDESVTSSNQEQYPFKIDTIQSIPAQSYNISSLQPTADYWQTSSISSDRQAGKQASGPGMIQSQQAKSSTQHVQSPVPVYLQISDNPQTKEQKTDEYTPMQLSWQQQMLPSYQTDHVQSNLSVNMKQEPATPEGKGQTVGSSYSSPGFDSRFTESLSNLLGSPPPDSPLSKNPILGDLQALLNRECKREIVPQTLFSIQGTNKSNAEKKPLNVFERERNLQERFTKLQSSHTEDVRQLSSMFRYQSALIETERFRTLHECQYPGSYKESVNHHYNNQLHKVMDRVERSVELLENSNKENKASKVPKMRPHLNKEAIRLMEHWYNQNLEHPYPTSTAIEMLAQVGNIGIEQVKKWFANKRNRNSNTRSLTEIAMQKRKLGQMSANS